MLEMMAAGGVLPDLTSFNCLLNAYAGAAAAGQVSNLTPGVGPGTRSLHLRPDPYTSDQIPAPETPNVPDPYT